MDWRHSVGAFIGCLFGVGVVIACYMNGIEVAIPGCVVVGFAFSEAGREITKVIFVK